MSIAQDCFPKSFLNEIIKKQFKRDLEIVSTNVSYLVTPGENYIGELLKIEVSFSEKNSDNVRSMSMIVKRLLENEVSLKLNADMGLFDCELGIYGEIVPMMEKLENKKKVAPKLYHAPSTKLFVMEDLSVLNYKMPNRQEGLNLEHSLIAFEKLAYFHATSLALYEKDANIMDRYNKGSYYQTDLSEKVYLMLLQETENVCKRETSLQKYYEKIRDVKEKMYETTRRDKNLNVLNHGDFWCNNLMFHYDADGLVDDILFVDFQGSVFASPFLDIHYFIALSTNVEVKEKHINDILLHYYEAFLKNAKILKLKTAFPNWNDFKKEYCNKAYIGLVATCTFLPTVKANRINGASIANLMESGEEGSFRHHCFTNSNYIDTMKILLPFYESLGAFNN